jgi:hypothetical protein
MHLDAVEPFELSKLSCKPVFHTLAVSSTSRVYAGSHPKSLIHECMHACILLLLLLLIIII